MRTMRPSVAWMAGVVVASLFTGQPTLAQESVAPMMAPPREAYPMTLYFGSGLINIPVAYVSSRMGDVNVQTTAKTIRYFPDEDAHNFATRWNSNIALETHWMGRFTAGVSAYSQNPEYGFFGQALLLRDGQFPFLPGFAIGVRNIGPYKHEERFLVGHDVRLDSTAGGYEEVVPFYFEEFSTAPTFYAVATKDFAFTPVMPGQGVSGSFSIGWGNGLFSDDGNLGDRYNDKGTLAKGLFLGGRVVMHPSLNTTVSILAENDAWDWNAGLLADWRGITLGLYGTELEEGGERKPESFNIYNYRKWNVTLGYQGNVFDIARGILLRTRITELTVEQQRLRYEIAARERRIRGLEVALNQARRGELETIARRRAEMERQLQEERDAIRRAEERLRQIQEGQRPPATPSTPPAGSPPTGASPSIPLSY